MKVSYYAVYKQNAKKKVSAKIDFKKVVTNIIASQKAKRTKGKNLSQFISHVIDDVYLFVKINDSEILKKVDTSTLSVDDLNKLLSTNEEFGFTSYFIVNDNVIGYGCTLFSSKINKFEQYINENCGLSANEEIVLEPLINKITKSDAMKLGFIGKTTLRIEKNNGLFGIALKGLSLKGLDEELIDGIEITIKPKRSKNIRNPVNRMIDQYASDVEMMKFIARDHLADQAKEMYLSDNILYSIVNAKKTKDIPALMKKLYLQSKKDILDKQTVLFKNLKI